MMNLPPIKKNFSAGSTPLPAGAQLIFAQARAMERAGAVLAKTTLFWKAAGPMDEAAMCRAMDTLIRTRDYLHLKIEIRDGMGVLQAAVPEPVQVEPVDAETLADQMSAWSIRTDPSPDAPACSLRLLKLGKGQYAIGLSGPHDLLDVWTVDQTLTSLALIYNGILDDQTVRLDQAPGFMDFAAWYESLRVSGRMDSSRAFWQELLDGVSPVFKAPPDPDPSRHPMAMVQSALPLDSGLCRKFEAKIRTAGVSTFEGYFTLFFLALSRLSGQQKLLAAHVASLRRVSGLAGIEGCLLNRFYIPVRLALETDFASAAGQVSRIMKSVKDHCLWPVWQDQDPEGTGYPGLFFHYVPPDKREMPEFRNLSVSPFKILTQDYWPHPMAFEVMLNMDPPMLFAIGQAGFCSQDWLKNLQQIYAEIMAKV